jgi:hypothetical protein
MVSCIGGYSIPNPTNSIEGESQFHPVLQQTTRFMRSSGVSSASAVTGHVDVDELAETCRAGVRAEEGDECRDGGNVREWCP